MKKTLTVIALACCITHMSAQSMKALQISTTQDDIWHVYPATVKTDDNNPQRLLFDSSDVNCTFRSFGTCFNELDWLALKLLPQEEQDRFFKNVFSPDGDLRFTLGRIPMGASDYAAPENFYTELYHERNEGIDIWNAWYSPDEMPKGQQDLDMEHFTLERDRKAIIPFIKRAQQENPDLDFWCSPWSPPQWMKHSEHYSNRAGYGNGLDITYPRYTTQFKMEDAILKAHAKYFSTFITEYSKEGIPITGCCYQNEAYTVNYYPNTSWSAEDAGRFNADYLIPYLNEHNPGVKVWLGTLNTADVVNIETILNTVSTAKGYEGKRLSEMVAGAAFQWEGRNSIGIIRKDYPALEMIQSESECGGGTFDWGAGVHTFELIHHYLNNGCVDYTNWNSILGGNGRGPFMNWWQNALVHINERLPRANGTCTATYTPEYFAYKHYSHFLCKGTKILNKPSAKDLLLVAKRPDGMYIAVVGNEGNMERSLKIDIDGHCIDVNVPAHSMNTFVVGTEEQINTLAVEEGLKEGETEYPVTNTHSVYLDPEEEYYLYNIKEGKFFNAGGRYGTRPVLDNIGASLKFEYTDSGDDYYIKTPYGNNTYFGYIELNKGFALDQQYFLDSQNSKERLTFYPTQEENVYAIGIFGSYLTFRSDLSIDGGKLNDGEMGYGPKIAQGDDIENMDGVLWKLVTREERLSNAYTSSADSPADLTFLCLANPDFNRLNSGNDNWSVMPATPGMATDPYREYVGEFTQSAEFDSYIELTHMPAGIYEFSLVGYSRSSSAESTASIYISADETSTQKLPVWDETKSDTSPVMELREDNYPRTSVSTIVKDGVMRIGIKCDANATDGSILFDRLRINYHPYASNSVLNMEYLDKLNQSIMTANSALNATSNPEGKNELNSAIIAAQKVYNDQASWHVSQQAIFDLEDALKTFYKGQDSGSVLDVINDHRGDASFLLPKITAWHTTADKVERYELTNENWDGKEESPAGLIKLYYGTASTTLVGMPAGKYRMVASVRGPKNMRIHAAINDIAETSLILSGWNFAEVGNVPIINTNGVQMPPTSIESAYNQGAYCQGWHWLAVEGTLEHAGELLLTFSSNAGEAQISNVYLYYLDGGNVISLVENEHLANRDKTVTADICVSSPNAITSSDTPITTAAGETMVNNVANGEIEQLVLYESHAFTPIDATAVNAKLYKKFSKSMWNVVTLPFIPEHKFTYYSPFHIEDNTIYISETTPESNTPYIMKSDSVRTYITGKNVVLKAEMNTVNMGDALLEGNYDLLTFEQNDNYYTWGTNRFAIVSETVSINPFAAWLQLSTPTNVKSYKLEVADPTAIEQVQVSTDSDNTPTYDLTGRIVPDNMKQKGIYLKKGNKYYINK